MGMQAGHDPVSRETVEAFYDAFKSYDAQRIGPMLDDDVEWIVSGPVEVMQFCGTWRGKPAVIERFASHVPRFVTSVSIDIEHLLVDGDRSAVFGRIHVCKRGCDRTINHGFAQIVRYRNGKVLLLRSINDTLDAAEQYLGRPIVFDTAAPPVSDDVIAV